MIVDEQIKDPDEGLLMRTVFTMICEKFQKFEMYQN